MDYCTNCNYPRGEHRSLDLACPFGTKTRIGFISYSPTSRYSAPVTPSEDDTTSTIVNTLIATEIASGFDSPSFDSSSTDTSSSSTDFGGFDGGSSGGGGSDSSW